ncbi:IMCp domain-containing protein [Cohnella silvisoli]|uniref:Uncharacterized protein n=1 Tax=Cohnella silvisoli TaxID=2873699 RepID=A0ABV1L4C7_9BACL|nr:IMCp domain-containing protein [Cohnella silvisoli]MCD9025834.1 hypothetical protein [Cohnella silvisoli]
MGRKKEWPRSAAGLKVPHDWFASVITGKYGPIRRGFKSGLPLIFRISSGEGRKAVRKPSPSSVHYHIHPSAQPAPIGKPVIQNRFMDRERIVERERLVEREKIVEREKLVEREKIIEREKIVEKRIVVVREVDRIIMDQRRLREQAISSTVHDRSDFGLSNHDRASIEAMSRDHFSNQSLKQPSAFPKAVFKNKTNRQPVPNRPETKQTIRSVSPDRVDHQSSEMDLSNQPQPQQHLSHAADELYVPTSAIEVNPIQEGTLNAVKLPFAESIGKRTAWPLTAKTNLSFRKPRKGFRTDLNRKRMLADPMVQKTKTNRALAQNRLKRTIPGYADVIFINRKVTTRRGMSPANVSNPTPANPNKPVNKEVSAGGEHYHVYRLSQASGPSRIVPSVDLISMQESQDARTKSMGVNPASVEDDKQPSGRSAIDSNPPRMTLRPISEQETSATTKWGSRKEQAEENLHPVQTEGNLHPMQTEGDHLPIRRDNQEHRWSTGENGAADWEETSEVYPENKARAFRADSNSILGFLKLRLSHRLPGNRTWQEQTVQLPSKGSTKVAARETSRPMAQEAHPSSDNVVIGRIVRGSGQVKSQMIPLLAQPIISSYQIAARLAERAGNLQNEFVLKRSQGLLNRKLPETSFKNRQTEINQMDTKGSELGHRYPSGLTSPMAEAVSSSTGTPVGGTTELTSKVRGAAANSTPLPIVLRRMAARTLSAPIVIQQSGITRLLPKKLDTLKKSDVISALVQARIRRVGAATTPASAPVTHHRPEVPSTPIPVSKNHGDSPSQPVTATLRRSVSSTLPVPTTLRRMVAASEPLSKMAHPADSSTTPSLRQPNGSLTQLPTGNRTAQPTSSLPMTVRRFISSQAQVLTINRTIIESPTRTPTTFRWITAPAQMPKTNRRIIESPTHTPTTLRRVTAPAQMPKTNRRISEKPIPIPTTFRRIKESPPSMPKTLRKIAASPTLASTTLSRMAEASTPVAGPNGQTITSSEDNPASNVQRSEILPSTMSAVARVFSPLQLVSATMRRIGTRPDELSRRAEFSQTRFERSQHNSGKSPLVATSGLRAGALSPLVQAPATRTDRMPKQNVAEMSRFLSPLTPRRRSPIGNQSQPLLSTIETTQRMQTGLPNQTAHSAQATTILQPMTELSQRSLLLSHTNSHAAELRRRSSSSDSLSENATEGQSPAVLLELRRNTREPVPTEQEPAARATTTEAAPSINLEQLQKVISELPQLHPDQIADQVYKSLMKRMKFEQRLRGY